MIQLFEKILANIPLIESKDKDKLNVSSDIVASFKC